MDKNSEKTVTKSAEKRKIQVSSPVEIKKKVKKTNIIKTITHEPEGKFETRITRMFKGNIIRFNLNRT